MPYIVREHEAKRLEVSTIFGGKNERAEFSQAIASPVSKNMTAGYIKLHPGYAKELVSPVDEIDLFLEGSLAVHFDGTSFTARKGDIVLIEKGSRVKFITEQGCLAFFVTYPLLKEAVDTLRKK